MKSFLRCIAPVLILALVLGACSMPSTPAGPEQDPNAIYTEAAQTVSAQLTQGAPTPAPPTEAAPVDEPTSEPTPPPTEAPTVVPTVTPTAEPTQTSTPEEPIEPDLCTNKAEFVEDVNIPDDTAFLPGETFTKTWRLRNVGTCTWTTEFSLVFADGELMDAPETQRLSGDVPPDATVDVSVALKAPGTPGTYRSDWKLSDANGIVFGLGDEGNQPFWVQIVVEEGTEELDLGNPTWTDTFEDASNWYLLDTENSKFEVEDGQLVMTAFHAGEPEEWGLSAMPDWSDFYLELTITTGESCSGLDRYGVLVRAPDPNAGYVFGFSCDGSYRLYKWDGENYQAIQSWKASPHINAGSNETNRLGIWLQGNTIKLYANGKLLAEFNDDAYEEGRFGLFIGSTHTDNLKIYVDEVSYWELED